MSQNTIPLRQSPQNSTNASGKLLWVALALGVLAMVLNLAYIQLVKSQVSEGTLTVYQFNRPIKANRPLQRDDLTPRRIPESFRDSVQAMGWVLESDLSNRIGMSLQEDVPQGAMLSFSQFQLNANRRMDEQITRDKRLISLPINSRTVPGALRVGMYVDIEAPFSTGGSYAQILPVLEHVQIQALGTQTIVDQEAGDRPTRSYQTITIEVSPEEATQMATIQRLAAGDFELQLRNPTDTRRVKIPEGGINPAVQSLIARITRENPTPSGNRR
jgi:Flp pilus assembly protein CpaB